MLKRKSKRFQINMCAEQIAIVSIAWLFLAHPVFAQTVANIPTNSELSTSVPSPVSAGDIWNLDGDVSLTQKITIPTGSTGLTINGNGHTITVGSAGSLFSNIGTAATLNLSNLTLTGNPLSACGTITNVASTLGCNPGLPSANANLTLVTSGTVSILNNGNSSSLYSAVRANGSLAITGNGTLEISNNSHPVNTPATISATKDLTINEDTVILRGNSGAVISAHGTSTTNTNTIAITANTIDLTGNINGPIFSYYVSSVSLTGGLTISNNVTNTMGAAIAIGDGGVSGSNLILNATSNSVISNNHADDSGGAFHSLPGNITLNATGGNILLSGNSSGQVGGVLGTNGNTTINHTVNSGNTTLNATGGDITFSGNSASNGGGAIWTGNAIFNATGGDITFSGNSIGAGKQGAAVATGYATLNATGGDITFSGNKVGTNANAIFFYEVAGANLNLNTNAGHAITFYDPIAKVSALNVSATGSGTVIFDGSHYTSLTDQSSAILANTTVQGGTFRVDNGAVYGITGSSLTVQSGGTLGGNGTIGGNVLVANGGVLIPGGAVNPGTLTINGNLGLNTGSILNYRLGQANTPGGLLNDLTQVNGNLTLDGTLNVTTPIGGTFDPGVYRIFNYTGSLTNNGLLVGSIPSSGYSVQTSVSKQVNLILNAPTSGLTLNYWDGAVIANQNNSIVDGGNGIWQTNHALANNNWTNSTGTINANWTPAAFAIFEGAPGTVTVDNSLGQVTAGGMQFAVNGYVISGSPITLTESNSGTGKTIMRVGDGTSAGAGYTATINALLQGTTQLTKTDLGTLVLTGNNTYSGGTAINGGSLQVSADANLGNVAGGLSLDSGTLVSTTSFSSGRATMLNAGGGTFNVANGTTLTMSGAITGSGALTKINSGTMALTGSNTYTGNTFVSAGTLQAGVANTFSANSIVQVASAGTLDLNGHNQTVAGLSNAGMVNMGTGSTPGTILTVNGNYIGNGGAIAMNTYWGGDSSPTDRLVLDGGHASGNTALIIKHAGGSGAQTNTGLLLVDVKNGATTDTSAFHLSTTSDGYRQGVGTIAAGPYEYTLKRSGNGGVADSWYLTSALSTPATCTTDAALCSSQQTNTQSQQQTNTQTPLVRPEVGSYMQNRYFASTMLFHTLHDRQGQLPDWVGKNQSESADTNAWVRLVGQISDRTGVSGMDISDTTFLIHGGKDLVQFKSGKQGSVRFGAMAAYGNSSNGSDNGKLSSHGSVEGYSVGAYGTWYGNSETFVGPYVDSWIMLSHFRNSVSGQGLPTERYSANSLTASLETGYAFSIYNNAGIHGFIEPQGQIIVSNYNAGNHIESNGTLVSGQANTSVTTRLGVRVFGNIDNSLHTKQIKPFVEVNWWHGPASQNMVFDGISVNDGLPTNRIETKIGVQGNLTKALNMWSSVSADVGARDYKAYRAQLGIKYSW